MSSTVSVPAARARTRSRADRKVRRLLRIPDDAEPVSITSANNAFTGSIAISGLRCLVTYILIPVVGSAIGLSGMAGPLVGIVLSAVSVAAIAVATRRLFAAEHRWRWPYVVVGSGIVVFLVAQSTVEVITSIS